VKTDTKYSSETSVYSHETIWRNNPKDHHLYLSSYFSDFKFYINYELKQCFLNEVLKAPFKKTINFLYTTVPTVF
jgi:hypothetical protein